MRALTFLVSFLLATHRVSFAQGASPSGTEGQTPIASDEVPKGYEIGEKTVSPDGRFAILYPLRDAPTDANDHYPPNLLVRLKPFAVIATVEKDGLPQNVTTELNATWNGNSTVAIWEYRHWGIIDLNVYEIESDKLKRMEPVMREAMKYFQRDMRARFLKKYPKESETIIFLSGENKPTPGPDFKFDERKLLLDLAADNKPNLAGGPHWTAELHAIWNLDTGKFDKVDFRPGKIEVRKWPE
jgi:hypothetical protein